MKTYPTISRDVKKGQKVYMFDKLDGSNIRVEWTKKSGFDKFGSRKRLLGSDQDIISSAPEIFHRDYEGIDKIFLKNRWQKVTLYLEFVGENSFAGTHDKDDDHELVLIDVSVHKKGILPPSDFIKLFKGYNCAELLHYGNVTQDMVEDIKNSNFEGVTFEGVVCKYTAGKGQWKAFKVKSDAWLSRLKDKCGDDEKMFEMLK